MLLLLLLRALELQEGKQQESPQMSLHERLQLCISTSNCCSLLTLKTLSLSQSMALCCCLALLSEFFAASWAPGSCFAWGLHKLCTHNVCSAHLVFAHAEAELHMEVRMHAAVELAIVAETPY